MSLDVRLCNGSLFGASLDGALDLIPPFAKNVARRVLPGARRKQYRSYEAALADCTELGYENHEIVDVVLRKTLRYRDEIASAKNPIQITATNAYSLCSLLASIESSQINVIDFGGACGAHYFLARALLPKSWKVRWVVVETPEMASRAAAVLSSEELRFSSDLLATAKSMEVVNLLHASGTLQVVDRPYEYLTQIVSTHADHILFNRLGLTKGSRDVVTIHESWLSWNGPGPLPNGIQDKKVRYPFIFPRQDAFDEILERDYDVILKFTDGTGVFRVGREPLIGLGLLASIRRKNSAVQ